MTRLWAWAWIWALAGGCAPDGPGPVVLCPGLAALPAAVEAWASLGAPVRIAGPGEPCDPADTDVSMCTPGKLGCGGVSPLGVHVDPGLDPDYTHAVLVHEIGHALGIWPHSLDPESIMYETIGPRNLHAAPVWP